MRSLLRSTGKLGAVDEYLQVKLTGKTKNIRLKENAFKDIYIVDRELLREKPSDKEISKNVEHWIDTRSHEMKHIHTASPKTRKEYYALPKAEQQEFLHERRNDFTRRYDRGTSTRSTRANNIRPSGRATNREFSFTGNGRRGFTQVTNGLPDMPQRHVDGANAKRYSPNESVLPSNEHNNMEFSPSRPIGLSRNNQLRRVNDRSGRSGGRGRGLKPEDSFSLPEQLLNKHQTRTSPQALQQFREIRRNLDPVRVLNHFEKTHGLLKSNYTTFKAKDGSARIKVGVLRPFQRKVSDVN